MKRPNTKRNRPRSDGNMFSCKNFQNGQTSLVLVFYFSSSCDVEVIRAGLEYSPDNDVLEMKWVLVRGL